MDIFGKIKHFRIHWAIDNKEELGGELIFSSDLEIYILHI